MRNQAAPNMQVMGRRQGPAKITSSDATSVNVYNQGYSGKTYSVKYLGIVDGTMGILSRKMALQGVDQQPMTIPEEEPQPQVIPFMDNSFTGVQVTTMSPAKPKFNDPVSQPTPFGPVLGRKNYTETLGRSRRTEIIDETTQLVHEVRPPIAQLRQSVVQSSADKNESVRKEIAISDGPT